jgi:hypothetical protein
MSKAYLTLIFLLISLQVFVLAQDSIIEITGNTNYISIDGTPVEIVNVNNNFGFTYKPDKDINIIINLKPRFEFITSTIEPEQVVPHQFNFFGLIRIDLGTDYYYSIPKDETLNFVFDEKPKYDLFFFNM